MSQPRDFAGTIPVYLSTGVLSTYLCRYGRPVRRVAALCLFALTGCEQSSPHSSTATPTPTAGVLGVDDRLPVGQEEVDVAEVPVVFRFVERLDESGIDFVHVSGTSEEKPFPAANGSGIGVIDFDADGRCDLFFATAIPFRSDSRQPLPRQRLYRNRGDWSFDAAQAAGLDNVACGAGVAVGDVDADGFPDLYLTCYGENRLYHNQGDGTFLESAECRDDRWATSAVFFDADGDGLLDLYVGNYARWTLETNKYCGDASRGVRIFCSPRSVEPEADVFYRNAGDGRFEDATGAAGFDIRPGRTQGVVAADLDGDRRTDLYVGNDLNPNTLFLAGRDGRFRDMSEPSGVAYDSGGRMQAGMGVDVGDSNGDGRFDLFVTNFEYEHNTLYQQGDGGFFNDVSQFTGLAAPSLPWIGWGTAFVDLDLDGRQDLAVCNGHTDDNLAELGREGTYEQPPLLFRNLGTSYVESMAGSGRYFQMPHPARALVVADLDDDLDPDLAIGHQDRPPALLDNDSPASHGALRLRVRLVGTGGNRDAIGATLVVTDDTGRRVLPVRGGGSYLSSHDRRVMIAAPHETVDLEVHWPWGDISRYDSLEAGHDYLLVEPADQKLIRDPVVLTRLLSSRETP